MSITCLFEMVGKSNSGPEYPQGHVPKPKSGSLITILASRAAQNYRTAPYRTGRPKTTTNNYLAAPYHVHQSYPW